MRLSVVHNDFDEGSNVIEAIGTGWRMGLSSLKSWIKTGTGLEPNWTAERAKQAAQGAQT